MDWKEENIEKVCYGGSKGGAGAENWRWIKKTVAMKRMRRGAEIKETRFTLLTNPYRS